MIVCHWWKWNHPNLDSTATASSRKWFEALNLNERSKLNQEVYCFCLIVDQIKKMDYCISNEIGIFQVFLEFASFSRTKNASKQYLTMNIEKKVIYRKLEKVFHLNCSLFNHHFFFSTNNTFVILSYDIFENNVGKTASVVWSFCRM